tara:strand:- start:741 stop:1220 length:480 start_codon:yes stop_codon:yes gene_type:complete
MRNTKYESFEDAHLGIKTKQLHKKIDYKDFNPKALREKYSVGAIKKRNNISLKKIIKRVRRYFAEIFSNKKVTRLDRCTHDIYDPDNFTDKIYEEIKSEDGAEIVLRRYTCNRTKKSKYQIAKFFLCKECYNYRLRNGRSAIDLTPKEFKELIDGYINS